MVAAAHQQSEIAEILILNGADLDALGPEGKTPLELAADANDDAMIHLLVSYGANVSLAAR